MNGVIVETEREQAILERRSAVDVSNGARWNGDTDRLTAYPATGDRSTLLRAHAAKSVECAPASPRARRAPRESRRVSYAQASGYVQLNQYRLLEPIGQGSYGIVKLAYNEEDDTHYAMKILSKRKLMRRAGLFGRAPPRRPAGPPPEPLQRVYREIAVLKKLDHPNVVKLVEVLDDPAEDQLYLVFQLLEGGPVIDIPTEHPLSEEVARKYFRDVLLGVEYLHYQRIAHRDIKPANLLLGEGRVQVADLGACGELAGRLSGAVGTPAFRAPEAAATDNYRGEAADIWSLGVTLYCMVTGRVPWLGSNSVELQRRVISDPLAYPPHLQPSPPLRRLLAVMLEKDPATRATMHQIKEHEWVTADGAEPLPSEQDNCRLVEVTEEDLARVVTSIPNLSTLILIKTMLKKHSFQNPFLRSREGSARRESVTPAQTGPEELKTSRRGGLARAGRSLSAPGNYLTERQASFDIALDSVQEGRDQNQDIPLAEGGAASVSGQADCQSISTSYTDSTSRSAESQSVSTSPSVSSTQSVDKSVSSKSASKSHSVSENQSTTNSPSVSEVQSVNSSQNSVAQSTSDIQSENGSRCVRNSHSFTLNQPGSNNKNGFNKTASTNKCVSVKNAGTNQSGGAKSVCVSSDTNCKSVSVSSDTNCKSVSVSSETNCKSVSVSSDTNCKSVSVSSDTNCKSVSRHSGKSQCVSSQTGSSGKNSQRKCSQEASER